MRTFAELRKRKFAFAKMQKNLEYLEALAKGSIEGNRPYHLGGEKRVASS